MSPDAAPPPVGAPRPRRRLLRIALLGVAVVIAGALVVGSVVRVPASMTQNARMSCMSQKRCTD